MGITSSSSGALTALQASPNLMPNLMPNLTQQPAPLRVPVFTLPGMVLDREARRHPATANDHAAAAAEPAAGRAHRRTARDASVHLTADMPLGNSTMAATLRHYLDLIWDARSKGSHGLGGAEQLLQRVVDQAGGASSPVGRDVLKHFGVARRFTIELADARHRALRSHPLHQRIVDEEADDVRRHTTSRLVHGIPADNAAGVLDYRVRLRIESEDAQAARAAATEAAQRAAKARKLEDIETFWRPRSLSRAQRDAFTQDEQFDFHSVEDMERNCPGGRYLELPTMLTHDMPSTIVTYDTPSLKHVRLLQPDGSYRPVSFLGRTWLYADRDRNLHRLPGMPWDHRSDDPDVHVNQRWSDDPDVHRTQRAAIERLYERLAHAPIEWG